MVFWHLIQWNYVHRLLKYFINFNIKLYILELCWTIHVNYINIKIFRSYDVTCIGNLIFHWFIFPRSPNLIYSRLIDRNYSLMDVMQIMIQLLTTNMRLRNTLKITVKISKWSWKLVAVLWNWIWIIICLLWLQSRSSSREHTHKA